MEAVVGGALGKEAVTRVRQNGPPAAPSSVVVLHPASTAAFALYGEDYDVANNRACPETSSFLVTPPHESSPISVLAELPDCGSSFYVAPVISGSIDRQAWSTFVTG